MAITKAEKRLRSLIGGLSRYCGCVGPVECLVHDEITEMLDLLGVIAHRKSGSHALTVCYNIDTDIETFICDCGHTWRDIPLATDPEILKARKEHETMDS